MSGTCLTPSLALRLASLIECSLGDPAHYDPTRSPTRSDFDEGEESLVVWVPKEWLRDPASRYLREHVVDVPCNEPDLLDAFTAMRAEG